MFIFLNGEFVPEEAASVSVLDRGFLYGDGLFETLLVFRGKPFRWAQHMDRLQQGADFLKIRLPFPADALREFARQLIAKNGMPESLLRITLSRGVGPRGYSPKGADRPTLVLSLHSAPSLNLEQPPKWQLITSSFRLPANERLAQFKTANKLAQVLARGESDAAGADEALLLNTEGFVVEGATSNLFWIEQETVCTPPLASGILSGVTRAVVLDLCRSLRLNAREANIRPDELRRADGIFVSLSSLGVVEAARVDGYSVKSSALFEKVNKAYWRSVSEEAGRL